MRELRNIGLATFIICILIGSIGAQEISVWLVEPPTDGVISCDDQQIELNIVTLGEDSTRVLIIEPSPEFGESPTGYGPADWARFADTLSSLGFYVDILPLSSDFSSILPSYDIVIIYGNPGREFSGMEIVAFFNFLSAGGNVLSVVRANAGDVSEMDIHNPILTLAGMNYSPPRTDIIDTIDVASLHPALAGVNELTVYRPMPISCSPDQQIVLTPDYDCIIAADSSLGGKIIACGEENLFHNGPLVFAGVPVYWDILDNRIFTLSAISWFASGLTPTGCGLDTASSYLDIDGWVYFFSSPEFYWDGLNLTFSPGVDFWDSGIHNIQAEIFDSCGHSIDLEFTLEFDVDAPRATLIEPPSGLLESSGDTVVVFVQDYENVMDTANSYIVVDLLDTFWLETHIHPLGFWLLPSLGWTSGTHQICVYAQDSPDYCPPNVLDSCFTIVMPEETLRVEVADVWVEGCSLVYTEVCVRSADRYVKDLYLDNFAFFENGIPVVPPSLELLNACPSESAMVDIVLLLDFSTSMNDEVSTFFGSIPSFVAALGVMDYRISAVVFNGCPEQTVPDDGVWMIVRTDFSSVPCSYIAGGPDWWATNLTDFNCLYNAVVNDVYTWPATMRGSGNEDQYGAIVRANENLDFRDGALKAFVLFTDERPIVDSPPCEPGWDESAEGLDSIIQYCIDNDIVMFPVTPHDGEFQFHSSESPDRRYYEGYYELGPQTGGGWFYLWAEDYDTLATQIGVAIADLPCCYLFRYREEQFCNEQNLLVVDAFQSITNFGRDDTVYSPPCPGSAEFYYPQPCGGITTCSLQGISLYLNSEDEFFAPIESTIILGVEPLGFYRMEDDEISFHNDTIEFVPTTDFSNGDTVCSAIVSGLDSMGCPITSDTCCFVVDLEPPQFDEIYPPPDTVMETTDFTVSLSIYDELAGVRWSEVGYDNFSVVVNGNPAEYSVYSAHPYMYVEISGVRNLDTIQICVDSIPDDPDYDYCPPNYNDTCWQFSIYILEGPIAQIILPDSGIISACVDQQIWIALTDSEGVDESTIIMVIDDDTFTCAE